LEITSSTSAEGKTLVSSNLAVTLAKRSGQTVLLIEGDLRKPAVCPLFGLPLPGMGLGDWWRDQNASIVPYIRRVADSTLCLLPAGVVQHPVTVLQSGRMTDLMRQLAQWFDWIVVDTPPLLPMADANLWARLADGTLLVIREGTVLRQSLQSAVDSMDSPKLVGLVLNDAFDYDRSSYDSYYAYSSSPAPKAKSKVTR
jgi:capsular exopolysaccharide synthesis family protein